MDRQYFFERNLLALSSQNPGLCSRLSSAVTTLNRYKFLESRSAETIPALVDSSGAAHPLHSMVDPRREAERLISTLNGEGFIIILGLGGGFTAEAILQREDVSHVLAVEYDINALAELFCFRDYVNILRDKRFHLMVDSAEAELEGYILENYQPLVSAGLRTLPLRTRIEDDTVHFSAAAGAIEDAVKKVQADYSVQAYFGTRWFSNIIRNLAAAEKQNGPFPPVREAAICAAGPSLDTQLPVLLKNRAAKGKDLFIIAADTSLPALIAKGLKPDAVISIDCQHISYQHFMGNFPRNIPLFLDLASPPLLSSLSSNCHFFSGGHPLTTYISRRWRPIPLIDTSGANVTYAGLSLAETLGAERIEIYGADFSYPLGKTYARGTYIFPFFEKQQTRLLPMEALFSAFLYRTPFSAKTGEGTSWYYETETMRRYRVRLEEKAAVINARIISVPGMGAPVTITREKDFNEKRPLRIFAPGKKRTSARDFLTGYRERIRALPPSGAGIQRWLARLDEEGRLLFTTMLPTAAALQRQK
ncbi:MAG: DUF115 domain-containing protein, partial [Treponema sp.]|nr:DUF115 domain-containing protein [Treponema sp.]